MISKETFAGNGKILNYLNKTLQKGCVSHAYLFEGPQHVGKTALSLCFAAELLGDIPENVLRNPDLIFVSAEEGTSQIGVDAVRELQKNLSLYPYEAKYKVAIIEKAELMNTTAANALLKTLEEPGKTSVLILISSDMGKMLDTVKSRCQTMSFNTVNEKTMRQFLESREVGKNIEDILMLADGKPGIAATLCTDEEALKNAKEARKKIIKLFGWGNFQKMEEAALIGTLDKDEIVNILDAWISGLRKEMINSVQAEKENCIIAKMKNALEKTISVREDILSNNANPRLAMENLCLGL